LSWLHTTPLRKYQVSKACLGRLVTLERLISASATVAEEALAEKFGAGYGSAGREKGLFPFLRKEPN